MDLKKDSNSGHMLAINFCFLTVFQAIYVIYYLCSCLGQGQISMCLQT